MTASYIDLNRFYCICFSLITLTVTNINSRTSSHWIFSVSKDQVLPIYNRRTSNKECESCFDLSCEDTFNCENIEDEGDGDMELQGRRLMEIIAGGKMIKKLYSFQIKSNTENQSEVDEKIEILDKSTDFKVISKETPRITEYPTTSHNKHNSPNPSFKQQNPDISSYRTTTNTKRTVNPSMISCQPYVNQTQYDHLNGLHYRYRFKFQPEPEVALIFATTSLKASASSSISPSAAASHPPSSAEQSDFILPSSTQDSIKINLHKIEHQLQEAKFKRPNSPNVYNNIGNLLRIHGESREAVECFRCALNLSPHHPDVLLNLARVLYNQHFYDDAIYLTRHSLETQLPNKNSWLQHFTLGEILQSTGHYQEARYHFLNVLKLKPGFKPAKTYLDEINSGSGSSSIPSGIIGIPTNPIATIYSIFVFLFLMILVLYVVCVNIDFVETDETQKVKRHFNRAKAMKTLKNLNCRTRPKRF